MQHAARYRGAEPYRHRRVITLSLYLTCSGTSSQWNLVCISCLRPRSNFRVPLTTRAAEFNTRCNLLEPRYYRDTDSQTDRQTDRQTKYTNVLFDLSILTTVGVFSFQSSMTCFGKQQT